MNANANAVGRKRLSSAGTTTTSSSSNNNMTTTATTTTAAMMTKMDATRKRIVDMEKEREERRKSMLIQKEARSVLQAENLAKGNPGDVDFIGMVERWRQQERREYQRGGSAKARTSTVAVATTAGGTAFSKSNNNICIAVRKRPMSAKERAKLDHDSVSVFSPQVTVHSAKYRVDGITKYLTHNSFQLDHAFDETSTTEDIYVQTTLPLVDHVLTSRGRATVFCYGQTGSGKTYTMNGIQQILAYDLYAQISMASGDSQVRVAMFELYGGFVQDLLHERQRCKLLEDSKGEINITGLQDVPAPTAEDLLRVLEEGNRLRTTHTTEANDTSSRSHAICQILLERDGQLRGKLTLVDLAGSERGSDTKSHNSQRRTESAEINTSLLSLKECIRALGQKSSHVPYRGSKLTLLLKDCFSPNSKTTMIATVSPGASSTDHSLNTLRYADRIKEQRPTSAPTIPSSSMKNLPVGGTRSPPPPKSQGPTTQRLQLIASVSERTAARRDDAADEVLAHENRTLTHTGLAEAAVISPSPAFIDNEDDEDDDDATLERLMTDDPDEFEQELEDMEYETSQDNDDDDGDDEDYNPAEEEEEDLYQKVNSVQQDEEEMRIIVQDLFELEEALLNQHMSNIQENAEMLTHEGKLLQSVQGASEDEMDEYAIQLAEYLDRKEILVYKLQQKLGEFKSQLAKEQEMAQKVHSLSQY